MAKTTKTEKTFADLRRESAMDLAARLVADPSTSPKLVEDASQYLVTAGELPTLEQVLTIPYETRTLLIKLFASEPEARERAIQAALATL